MNGVLRVQQWMKSCAYSPKHCRRIVTAKLAARYLALVRLASIRLCLRVYEFTT